MNAEDIDNFQLELGTGSEIILASAIIIMMFAVALGLRAEHFRFFKENPRVYLGGVFGQLVGLPLLTLGICYVVNPIPSIALGMILVACCPGGSVSNIIAMFGRANTALSVSLTATSSLAAAFLTPISILFWCSLYPPTSNLLTEINLDIPQFLIQTLMLLALPLLAGMCIAHFFPTRAAKWQKPMALVGAFMLAALVILASVKFLPVIIALGIGLFAIVILHNGLAFFLGFVMGVITKADVRSRRALTFEVGIQNSGLAIVILLTQLNGLGGAGAIAGIWGTWHIIGGLILVALFNWNDRHERNMG